MNWTHTSTAAVAAKKSGAPNTAKIRKTVINVIVHIFLAILAFIWVLPIFWVILTSFRGEKGSYVSTFFPKTYTFNNYIKLFTDTSILNFPKMFMNTFVIAIFTCIISTIFVLSVAYSMSRMRFKMRKPFMNFAMILGLFPSFMSMIAVYYILKAIGLSEGAMIRSALIIVYSAGTGVGFYVAKGFFDTIPYSLDESAMIDGATRLQIFTKITLPLSKPIIVYTALMAFMGPWVDFIFASVILGDVKDKYTVALGLYQMLNQDAINEWFLPFTAGAIIIAIPITLLFIFMQKYYVEGVTGGSVK